MSGPVISAKAFFVGQGESTSGCAGARSCSHKALLTRRMVGLQISPGTRTALLAPQRSGGAWMSPRTSMRSA